jgi:hypothetical protein
VAGAAEFRRRRFTAWASGMVSLPTLLTQSDEAIGTDGRTALYADQGIQGTVTLEVVVSVKVSQWPFA